METFPLEIVLCVVFVPDANRISLAFLSLTSQNVIRSANLSLCVVSAPQQTSELCFIGYGQRDSPKQVECI
ncbi:hypothetical protein L596_014271 [Steinernema carpocapsae]|uniref:Uncharacterized protein n=1 Tax=Steinernema carpocapsae TaxID=34508 RepID=A0A4U5NCJ5_STECR|nr:hypothetical protein L596_014271 [Steinernema carpocapsae]